MTPEMDKVAREILAELRDDDFLFALDYRGRWFVWKFRHNGRVGTIGCSLHHSRDHVKIGIFRWNVVLDEDGAKAELDAQAPA